MDIEFLYDMGASVSTIVKELFDRCFVKKWRWQYKRHLGPIIVGARAKHMGNLETYLPVTVNGKKTVHPFNVADKMEFSLISTLFFKD